MFYKLMLNNIWYHMNQNYVLMLKNQATPMRVPKQPFVFFRN